MTGLIAVKTKAGITGAPLIETDAVTSLVIRDQLPQVGSLAESSLVVPVTQTDGTTNPILAMLQDGRVIQVRATTGATTAIHAFLIEKRNRDVYDAANPSQRSWEVIGRTLPAVLTDARWKPGRGYKSLPWSSRRTFSFASLEFDPTMFGSPWPNAQEIARQDAPSTYYQGRPTQGWPDPTAYWITPAGQGNTDSTGRIGIWWTYGEFTLVAPTTLIILWAADNKADVFFDGQPIGRGDSQKGFGQTSWATVYADAGTHRIAAKVYNPAAGTIDDPPFGPGALVAGNPTAFMAACYPLDSSGAGGPLVIHTDHSWPTSGYGSTPPGLTYGQILGIGLDEAQADGLIPYVSKSFDDLLDSKGADWDVIESVTVNVGDSLLQSLDTWSLTYGDYAMPPSDFRLDLYKPGTRGLVQAVEFSMANHNLVHLAEDSTADTTDCLIVEWDGGQFRWPASGGDHQGFISTGAATTTEAKAIADAYLALHSGDLTQITPAIAPNSVFEGPRGVMPNGWWVGDTITVEGVADRVQSLVGTWQEGSGFDWGVALRTVHMKSGDAIKRWLQMMIPGAAGGQAPQAVPSGGGRVGMSSMGSTSGFTMTTAMDGTLDGIRARVAVVPDASDDMESGIVVKAPTSTWGKPLHAGGSPLYSHGQFISFHRFVAGLNDDPNASTMFRVDPTGGLGLTGAVHIATGLRQEVGYTATQAVWINPTFDTNHIVMTGVAGQLLNFLLATNSVGGQLFRVFANGAVQSADAIAAGVGAGVAGGGQIGMGAVGGFPSIQFGIDSTTFLARGSIAGRIRATNYLDAAKDIVAWEGTATKQVLIGDIFGVAGIAFGSAIDTILYAGTVAGQVTASNAFAVINSGSTSNVLLTLKGVSGQTGDHIRGVNSAGATVWSISAAGVFSGTTSVPSPISIAGQITAHNADAQLTQIGSIFGSAGIGMGSGADTILVRSGAGAAQISDSLTVQNVSHSAANVVTAIGASGQSGYLFLGVTNLGGTVFGVTIGGAVSCTSIAGGTITGSSLNVSGGAITGGAITGTTGTFSSNVGISGTTFSTGISNGNAGIVSTGAISGVTTLSASGAISGASLALGGTITGATSIAGTSLNVGTGTVTCGQMSALTNTSFVHSISSTNAVAASTFSATTVGGTSAFKAVTATSLSVSGSKAFVIDHPTKPGMKLVHASIEGPENAVYYRGQSEVGKDGTVVVTLPAYFEALTSKTSRTVQVTAVYDGKNPPQQLAATEPVDGSFIVAGHPGQRFFWHVVAIRCDIPDLVVEQPHELWSMLDAGHVPDFGRPLHGPGVLI